MQEFIFCNMAGFFPPERNIISNKKNASESGDKL